MNYQYQYKPENQPYEFLQEISEYYANAQYFNSDPEIILTYARKILTEIPDISKHINRQHFYKDRQEEIKNYIEFTKNDKFKVNRYPEEDDGDNEFISVFKWRCTNDVGLMMNWFKLLYKLGGNPFIKNVMGKTALDVCRERMLSEGYEEVDVAMFLGSLD